MNSIYTERMKTALGIPTMILAVTLASCGSTETEAGESNEANESAKAASLFKVGVSNIAPQAFTHRFSVQGNVETDRNALLTTEFGGAIEEVMVREGQQVSEGTPLVRVNTDVMERSAAELQTQLELAQAVFERQERLWDQSIGSEIEFLQAKTQLEAPRIIENIGRTDGNGGDARALSGCRRPMPRQDRRICRSRSSFGPHC
jgi:multidrug efflux pump subunit AcrA (membrane-fusion protein)